MTVRDALLRQGNFLFRYRGWTFVAALGLFLLALRDSQWLATEYGDSVDDVYDLACFGIGLLGLAARWFVAGHAPARTSGRNTAKGQVAQTLNVSGPYSVVRHPLYVGNFLIALGVALLPGSLWLGLVVCLGFLAVFERIMLAEEEYLRGRFGRDFEEWAERTPTFLPEPSLWRPSTVPFSWRTAIKREYLTTAEILLCFAVVDYAEDWVASGSQAVEWEPETTIPAMVVVGAALLVRFLRKRTRVLHVAGR